MAKSDISAVDLNAAAAVLFAALDFQMENVPPGPDFERIRTILGQELALVYVAERLCEQLREIDESNERRAQMIITALGHR